MRHEENWNGIFDGKYQITKKKWEKLRKKLNNIYCIFMEMIEIEHKICNICKFSQNR